MPKTTKASHAFCAPTCGMRVRFGSIMQWASSDSSWCPRVLPQAKAATSAMNGAGLMATLARESRTAGCAVGGEALGTVPEGFSIAWLPHASWPTACSGFETDGGGFATRPVGPKLAAACVSTHDLATLAGWWDGADIEERAALGLLAPAAVQGALAARQVERRDIGGSLRYREQTLLACHRRGRAPFRRHRAEPHAAGSGRGPRRRMHRRQSAGHRSRAPELAATAAVFQHNAWSNPISPLPSLRRWRAWRQIPNRLIHPTP